MSYEKRFDHIQDSIKLVIDIAILFVAPELKLGLSVTKIGIGVVNRYLKIKDVFSEKRDIYEILLEEQEQAINGTFKEINKLGTKTDTQNKIIEQLCAISKLEVADLKSYTWDQLDNIFSEVIKREIEISNWYVTANDVREVYKIFICQYEKELLKTKHLQVYINKQDVNKLKLLTNELQDDIKRLSQRVASLEDSTKQSKNPLSGKDRTLYQSHFMLFHSKKNIESMFIDGCYKIIELENLEQSTSSKSNSTLENCVNVINSQRLLLIEGGFGLGKTILTKRIQKNFIDNGYQTIFLNANDFCSEIKDSKLKINLSDYIREIQTSIYIFVDALDELNIDIDNGINAAMYFIESIIDLIAKNEDCYFIINSRPHLKITNKDELISMQTAYEYFNKITIEKFKYVSVTEFNNTDINNWLSSFNTSNKPSLTTTELKNWYKKALSSCKIPLFLFVVGIHYYDKFSLPVNNHEVYEYFIEQTIKGKFKYESITGSNALPESFKSEYELLLRLLAKDMISCCSDYIDYEDIDEGLKYNKSSFTLPLSDFKKTTQNVYKNFMEKIEETPKGHLHANILNCYFLKVFSNKKHTFICFTDNNILCLLAAEHVYQELLEILNYEMYTKEKADKLISNIGDFRLNPLSVDFLINKLLTFESDEIDKLTIFIREYFICFNTRDNLSNTEVQVQLLLQIIFIKLNHYSYKELGLEHYFKKFDKLCKIAKSLQLNGKHVDGKHRYLAERYFMDCKFYECIFRRLNLKYYNFKDSVVKNAEFEQCKFSENVFSNSQILSTGFHLCSFSNIILDLKKGYKIKFVNSKISDFTIKQFPDKREKGNIMFVGCFIDGLTIDKWSNYDQIISLEKCYIKDLSIVKCKFYIIINNCILENQVKINKSDYHCSISNNLLLFNESSIWKENIIVNEETEGVE